MRRTSTDHKAGIRAISPPVLVTVTTRENCITVEHKNSLMSPFCSQKISELRLREATSAILPVGEQVFARQIEALGGAFDMRLGGQENCTHWEMVPRRLRSHRGRFT